MVELHDSNGDRFYFLGVQESFFECLVFQHLVRDNAAKMTSFRDIPPVVTV